jgi:ring-1,2-phenylacetyl-CoA epoxidase subunit PaaC
VEAEAACSGLGVDVASLRPQWDAIVDDTLAEATLRRSPATGYVTQGKNGLHSEHLGYLLAEMQCLARAHPGAQW